MSDGAMMGTQNAVFIEHPGFYIKEEMEAREWLQRDLAFVLGISEQSLTLLLNGKRGITADMARALGEAFDVPAEFFANLQQAYDLAHAKTPDPSVAARRVMQSSFPVREMIKRGWIESTPDTALLEAQLASFFCVENVSEVPYLAHAAKKSRYESRAVPPAQLAWLFRVRHVADRIASVPYSTTKLRAALAILEGCLAAPEEARHVPRILAECGVRFVIVERLPGADIDGACFWLNAKSPVIGMTTRRDKIDNFWFVLRHEIEHVLRGDGKDEEVIDVDVESLPEDAAAVPERERVANAEAAAFCVPQERFESFMKRKFPFYYERDVVAFARTIGRHPGLVVGQMQKRLDRWNYLNRHLVRVRHLVLPGAVADGWGQTLRL